MPQRPWAMRQSWHNLLFAHWPVPAERLRALIPAPLALDTFDAQGWIGVVPFRISNLTARGLPALPWVSDFPELNVRTYVTVADKPGVYFFSLDAGNPLAVAAARSFFHLPYYSARMTVAEQQGAIRYRSRRTAAGAPAATFAARYEPVGRELLAVAGTLEYFLTERYCLYTFDRDLYPYRCDIQHRPWKLRGAAAEIEVNSMADAIGIRLPDVAPLLHFAARQDMVNWTLSSLARSG
ncbi:MAG: DUF2071 domain-containing protein [Acidobacteria bacterium]|nr:DUF2071 domain-containing protein [Acidobacteriota bacterium]